MAAILIADSEPATRAMLTRLLSGQGHTCTCVESGSDVLSTAERERPDVLIIDVMLPGMSGFEVCRRIRSHRELYTLPILVISAMREPEEIAHGLAQGADDYVTKPFDPGNLLQRLDTLLGLRASARGVDSLTELPGADGVRREVQRRLSRHDEFALGCAELAGLREFGRLYGNDARTRSIRHFGRVLLACGQGIDEDVFFLGHMGGGYFVFIVPANLGAAYGRRVEDGWERHLPSLLGAKAEAPRSGARDGESGKANGPEPLICVTQCGPRTQTTPQQLFDTLSQLRHRAMEARSRGVYMDQRSDPEGA